MQKSELVPLESASSNSRLEETIKALVSKKQLNLKLVKNSHPEYKYTSLIDKDLTDPTRKKMIDIGQKCKGIVVRKDQTSKELWIHLTKIIMTEPQNKYLMNQKSSQKAIQETYIHQFKQFAFIKDYDIKQSFSIFTYIDSYKDIKIGSEVFGVLVRKQKRSLNGAFLNNISAQNVENNIWFEVSVKNEPPKNISKITLPSFGISYDQRFSRVIDEDYQKNGMLSIGKLALYEENFQNNDIISKLRESLDIDLSQNINPISNIKALKHMHINFQRLIYIIKQDSIGTGEKVGWGPFYGRHGILETRQQPVRDLEP